MGKTKIANSYIMGEGTTFYRHFLGSKTISNSINKLKFRSQIYTKHMYRNQII